MDLQLYILHLYTFPKSPSIFPLDSDIAIYVCSSLLFDRGAFSIVIEDSIIDHYMVFVTCMRPLD